MNLRMKRNLILGPGLFVSELIAFFLSSNLIGIDREVGLMFAAIYFILLAFHHHYNFVPVLIWQEIVQLLRAHILYWVLCMIIGVYIKNNMIIKLSVHVVIIYCVAVLGGRAYRLCTKKKFGIRVLVLGAGDTAEKLQEVFSANRFMYINPKVYVDTHIITGEKKTSNEKINKLIIPLDEMDVFLEENVIDEVFIVDEKITSDLLEEIVERLQKKVPVIRYKPKMKIIQPYNTDIVDYDGNLFVSVSDGKRRYLDMFLKKVIDIMSGLVGCVLLIPLSVFVKIHSVRSGDKDSIFFKQERVGKNGKIIKVYKYRSMVSNAEQILEEMMKNDPNIRAEYIKNKKLDPDPRVTVFGNFLRKTSLDEFPQFINILKGDMSLIGPRPYLVREINDMGNAYETIIKTKPGITGIWQVSGRSDVTFERRCRLDEYYYNNWSIWLDMIILVKTIKVVLRRDGAV